MPAREALLAPIRDKLVELDEEFSRNLHSPIPLVAEVNRYVAAHAGKRIRPALLLLCARLLGYQGRADVVFAAVIEFIHTATLIHDDIIDNADRRRGHKSVNAIWGNNVTVLLGDYLYLKSMEMSLTQRSLRALDILTEVTIRMIEGELLQLAKKGDLGIGRDDYLEIIGRKTATLFSGCGRIAALLGEASDEQAFALAQYGLHVGIAFQAVDDILDFVGDEAVLGKPVLSDLREGRVTLPAIELAERVRPEESEPLRRVLETGEARPGDQERILGLLRRHGALEASAALAHEHAKEARKHLAPFPDSEIRRILEAVPEYIVSRTA
jgi:octaprenyl-diphosphate synthase